MGGLSRKATKIKQRSKTGYPHLLVDAGALLFPESDMAGGLQQEQARITARGIAEIYERLGYDAVGIAERDLAAGYEFLQGLTEQTEFPWLSANLIRRTDGEPLFTPSALIKKGGLRIGLTGLTNPEKKGQPDIEKEVDILPWRKVLPDILADLREEADLIILFSNLAEGQNREISSRYPEIQIIIQSGQRTTNLKPSLYDNTLVFQTSDQGKYLGEMEITWSPPGKWNKSKPANSLVNKKSELDRLNWQLQNLLKKGNPEEVYKNRPAMLKRIRYLQERTEKLTREIAQLEEEEAREQKGAEWDNTFWSLSKDIADDRKIVEIINEIKDQKTKLARKIKMTRDLPGYSGSANCQRCHEEIFKAWRKTPHARAWWTLKEKKENYNIKCLPCHVTGLSEEEGVRALSLPSILHNVGCESCHGPGSEHIQNPQEAGNINRSPGRHTCLDCHQQEHDDSFDFEKDRLLVH